jgi:DNA repair exonuclease SbcCD ATPase subunit
MRFLEILFGKKEEKEVAESIEEVFDIEKATTFLKKKYNEKFKLLNDEVKTAYEEMQAVLGIFEESLCNLAKANFNESLDSVSLQMAISQKKSFINKMKIMISQLNKPFDLSLDSIIEYQRSSLLSVKETDEHTVKEFIMFEQVLNESKTVFKNFKSVFNATKNFSDIVSKKKESLDPINDAENELESLKKNIEYIQNEKKEIDEQNKGLMGLKKRLESEEENLKKLKESDEWNRFNLLIERKKELNSHISELRANISQNFSKIEKPLKKFQHSVKVDKEEIDNEKMLNRYLDSPVDALIETENFSFIKSILERVKHSISSDAIDLKDKNKELSEIDWIINHNIFEELVTKHNSMIKEMKKLEKDIAEQDINKLKSEIENKIEQLNREIQAITTEIEINKKQTEKLEVSVQERKVSLERDLTNLTGSNVTIMIN